MRFAGYFHVISFMPVVGSFVGTIKKNPTVLGSDGWGGRDGGSMPASSVVQPTPGGAADPPPSPSDNFTGETT